MEVVKSNSPDQKRIGDTDDKERRVKGISLDLMVV